MLRKIFILALLIFSTNIYSKIPNLGDNDIITDSIKLSMSEEELIKSLNKNHMKKEKLMIKSY